MFHGFNFYTSEAGGFRGHTRFEGFVLCPDCVVENLEGCLLGLGREQGHGEDFIRVEEGVPPGEHHTVSLTSQV